MGRSKVKTDVDPEVSRSTLSRLLKEVPLARWPSIMLSKWRLKESRWLSDGWRGAPAPAAAATAAAGPFTSDVLNGKIASASGRLYHRLTFLHKMDAHSPEATSANSTFADSHVTHQAKLRLSDHTVQAQSHGYYRVVVEKNNSAYFILAV